MPPFKSRISNDMGQHEWREGALNHTIFDD